MHHLRDMPLEEPPPLDPQAEIPRLQRRNRVLAITVSLSIVFAIIGWVIGLSLGSLLRRNQDTAVAAQAAATAAQVRADSLLRATVAKDTVIAGLQGQLATLSGRVSTLAGSIHGIQDDMADVAATIDAEAYATKADVEQVTTANAAVTAQTTSALSDSLAAFRQALTDVEQRAVSMRYVGIDELRTELRVETGRIKRHQALTDAVGLVWSVINSVKR